MKTPRNKQRLKPITAQVKIHSLGAQGDGLADHEGQTLYLDNALAGEDVIATFQPEKSGIYRGKVTEVLSPSPHRVNAPCPHFHKCGGCALQHMDMDAYQSWKFETVRDYLKSKDIRPKTWDAPVFIPAGTRRRATLSALKHGNTLIIGYHQRHSHNVLNIKQCALLTPALENLIPILRDSLSPIINEGDKLSIFLQQADNGIDMVITGTLEDNLTTIETINALANDTDIIRISHRDNEKSAPETMIELSKPYVTFGSLQVPIAPLAFLQPSNDGENALCDIIQSYMPEGAKTAVDLFSGCGTFTGRLLKNGLTVDAFESDKTAINNLKRGGHVNGYVRDLFRDPLTAKELDAYDVAIIDPARAGAKAQSDEIANSSLETIIAVSCNPATFARDAKILIDGGYRLDAVTIVDQFIWSAHTELVAKFIQK